MPSPIGYLVRHLVRRGNRARDGKDWARAARAYRAALRLRPAMPHIWVQYGHALKESGNLAQALDAYVRADRLLPDTADTHVQIGHALKLKGDLLAAGRHYARAAELDPSLHEFHAAALRMRLASIYNPIEKFRFVIIGSTSVCNASCIHCPTGKASTDHVPRLPMAMPVYRRLMDELAGLGLPVTAHIGFGLFGDALADPFILDRVRYARALFPEVEIVLNTNGAAFSTKRHASLAAFSVSVSLHCESLVPETYDRLMHPLRFSRVLPKYEEVLASFPGRVNISVPVSRLNLDELPSIRDWFMERGARSVTFDPLSSRCADDRSVFDSLALRPQPIRCPSSVMEDLIVDADGKVLICCQDFQRREVIGDLRQDSLFDVLTGPRREEISRKLDGNRHGEIRTCRNCHADLRNDNAFLEATQARRRALAMTA